MIKNPERFEKVGKFNEGYAIAKLADGRGYVIINEEGEISKRIDKFGQKVESIISNSNIIDESLDKAYFKNGVITFRDKVSVPNGITRTTYVTTRTLNATKSGYIFVQTTENESYGEDAYSGIDEHTIETRDGVELQKLYRNPEKFFELVPGNDFKTLDELRGYLDVVQHSMEQDFNRMYRDDSVKNAIKFAEKVDKKFKKWQKSLAKDNLKEQLGSKIRSLGE